MIFIKHLILNVYRLMSLVLLISSISISYGLYFVRLFPFPLLSLFFSVPFSFGLVISFSEPLFRTKAPFKITWLDGSTTNSSLYSVFPVLLPHFQNYNSLLITEPLQSYRLESAILSN